MNTMNIERVKIPFGSGESVIEFGHIRRPSGKIVGGGIWLSQGDVNDPTDFWINEPEIDSLIEALGKAKNMIEEDRVSR